jgi:hypothetical protein
MRRRISTFRPQTIVAVCRGHCGCVPGGVPGCAMLADALMPRGSAAQQAIEHRLPQFDVRGGFSEVAGVE